MSCVVLLKCICILYDHFVGGGGEALYSESKMTHNIFNLVQHTGDIIVKYLEKKEL